MGTKWEQSGKKNPEVGQEWEQSGNKVGRRTPKWDKNGNKVGTKWEQSGNKVGRSGTRMGPFEAPRCSEVVAVPQRMYECVVFATMAKLFLPFSKEQELSHLYAVKNSFPRANDLAYCEPDKNMSASSHNFSKLVAAASICLSSASMSGNILSRSGSKAGSKCLASAALTSKEALLDQGLAGSVNIDNLKLVSLCSISCLLYSPWIS